MHLLHHRRRRQEKAQRMEVAELVQPLSWVLGYEPCGESMSVIEKVAITQLDFFGVSEGTAVIHLPDHVPFCYLSIREIMVELQRGLIQQMYSIDSAKVMQKLLVQSSKASPCILASVLQDDGSKWKFAAGDWIPIAGTVSLTPTPLSYPLCEPRLKSRVGG